MVDDHQVVAGSGLDDLAEVADAPLRVLQFTVVEVRIDIACLDRVDAQRLIEPVSVLKLVFVVLGSTAGLVVGNDAHTALAGIAAQAFQVIVRISLGKVELVALFGPVGIPAVVPALDQHASQAMTGSKVDVTLGILGRGTVTLSL